MHEQGQAAWLGVPELRQHLQRLPAGGLHDQDIGDRDTSKIGGYSFLVKLLSFMEYDTMYKQLPQSLTTAAWFRPRRPGLPPRR